MYIRGLISESNIPGAATIAGTRSGCRRLTWLLACFIFAALTTRDLYFLAMDYLDYPVNVGVKVSDSRVLPFPAVTVCNLNPVRRKKFCSHSQFQRPEVIEAIVCSTLGDALERMSSSCLNEKISNLSNCQKDEKTKKGGLAGSLGSVLDTLGGGGGKIAGKIPGIGIVSGLAGAALPNLANGVEGMGDAFQKIFQQTTGCSIGGSEKGISPKVFQILKDTIAASLTSGCSLQGENFLSTLSQVSDLIMTRLPECGAPLLRNLSKAGGTDEDGGDEDRKGEEKSPLFVLNEITRDFLIDVYLERPELVKETGHQSRNTLSNCFFSGTACSFRDFDTFYYPGYGNCFTFNTETLNGDRIKETGFTGPLHGLELTLNLETSEYMPTTKESGARIIVHDSKSRADPDQDAVHVPPGAVTYIGVKLINITRLQDPYPDKCSDDWSTPRLKRWADELGYHSYTPQMCLKLCLQERTMSRCQCARTSLSPIPPSQVDIPRCNNSNRVHRSCIDGVNQDYYGTLVTCDCPPKCTDLIYEKSISTGIQQPQCSILSDAKTRKIPKEDLAKVIVFYQSLSYQEIIQTPKYTLFALIGGIGGILGVYAGFSLLAVFEILEVIFRAIFALVSRVGQNSPTGMVKVDR